MPVKHRVPRASPIVATVVLQASSISKPSCLKRHEPDLQHRNAMRSVEVEATSEPAVSQAVPSLRHECADPAEVRQDIARLEPMGYIDMSRVRLGVSVEARLQTHRIQWPWASVLGFWFWCCSCSRTFSL